MRLDHAAPPMPDLAVTLEAIRIHGWHIVLLQPRSKKPIGKTWVIVTDPAEITAHVETGGGIGLVCGEASGVVVIDPDREDEWGKLCDMLEGPPAPAWVQTGSGRKHFYLAWEAHLPAKLFYGPVVVGEVQRGPGLQHVCMPPTIHPSGAPYRWLVDPREAIPELPALWKTYFYATGREVIRA